MDRTRNAASQRLRLDLPAPTNLSPFAASSNESNEPRASSENTRSSLRLQRKREAAGHSGSSVEYRGGTPMSGVTGGEGSEVGGHWSHPQQRAGGSVGGTATAPGRDSAGGTGGASFLNTHSLRSGASFHETPGLSPPPSAMESDSGVSRARKGSIRSAVRKIFGGGGSGGPGSASSKRRSREMAAPSDLGQSEQSQYLYHGQDREGSAQDEQTRQSSVGFGAAGGGSGGGDAGYARRPGAYPPPHRHGYHSSEPPVAPRLSIPRESPENADENSARARGGDDAAASRTLSIPAAPGGEIQRARSPYAVEFPRSARLKPLALGDPFYAPGSQLRRRKTLPSLQIAESDAAAITDAINSASADAQPSSTFITGQTGVSGNSASLEVPGADAAAAKRRSLAKSKRLSRSADDLRNEMENGAARAGVEGGESNAPVRKRSDEILYWRESFGQNVWRASGFQSLPSPPEPPVQQQQRRRRRRRPQRTRDESAEAGREVAASSAAGDVGVDETSDELEDRIAKLENGLLTFSDELRRITAGRNRSTVVVEGMPLSSSHLRSTSAVTSNTRSRGDGGRTASMLIESLGFPSGTAGSPNEPTTSEQPYHAYTTPGASSPLEGGPGRRSRGYNAQMASPSSPPQTPTHSSNHQRSSHSNAHFSTPVRSPPPMPQSRHEPSRSLDTAAVSSSSILPSFPIPIGTRGERGGSEVFHSRTRSSPTQADLVGVQSDSVPASQPSPLPIQTKVTASPPLTALPYVFRAPSGLQSTLTSLASPPSQVPIPAPQGAGAPSKVPAPVPARSSPPTEIPPSSRVSLPNQAPRPAQIPLPAQGSVPIQQAEATSRVSPPPQDQPTTTVASIDPNYTFRTLYTLLAEERAARRQLEKEVDLLRQEVQRMQQRMLSFESGLQPSAPLEPEETLPQEYAEASDHESDQLRDLLPRQMREGNDSTDDDYRGGETPAPEVLARQLASPSLYPLYDYQQQEHHRQQSLQQLQEPQRYSGTRGIGERTGVVSRFSGESVEGSYAAPPSAGAVDDAGFTSSVGEGGRQQQYSSEGEAGGEGGGENTIDSPHEGYYYPPWTPETSIAVHAGETSGQQRWQQQPAHPDDKQQVRPGGMF